ncbi:pilus assembly protein PilM [Phycisphaerales bacterium AB-hyl4]|uniref:Pilus assembly protein PilM n=1 Tax=Natronomicrosphaera hydrolytica TaxID=3242702 RepID=A0ABV4TZY9_9BACT
MAFGFSKTRYSPIAIDFGADSLKLLQVIPGRPIQLAAAAAEVIPAAARRDPVAREAFLAEALPRLVKSQPFKGRRAICSLPAFQTVVQHLEVPRADDASQFQLMLEQQLRERLEIDPRRMVVRHVPVGPVNRQDSAQMEVLCIAASREVVMRYIEIASKAKLDVVGMHSESWALCKAFDENNDTTPATPAKAVCYIDIGAASTKLVIAANGRLKFAKTVHAAGDEITRRLAAARHVDFEQARQLRIDQAAGRTREQTFGDDAHAPEHAMAAAAAAEQHAAAASAAPATGIPALDAQAQAGQRTAEAAAPPANDQTLASDTIECLVDELQMSIRYYQRLCPDTPIDRLVFLGGEARHVSTCQSIARAVRIAAQLGDPLASVVRITQSQPAVGVNLDEPQPAWAVPFGLCLSEANL